MIADLEHYLYHVAAHEVAPADPEAAVSLLERAMALNPGLAAPWSLRSLLLLRRDLAGAAPPPAQSAAADGSLLAMSTLGRNGRLGNQLLQYIWLYAMAQAHQRTLVLPDWPGRVLYDLDELAPPPGLSPLEEVQLPWSTDETIPAPPGDIDLIGYFNHSTRALRPMGEQVRARLRLTDPLQRRLGGALETLRQRGRTVIALHVRRGDFDGGEFQPIPVEVYVSWLSRRWEAWPAPVLYLASDQPDQVRGALAYFDPITASDLAWDAPGAEWLLDHHVLGQADVTAISNSTFSFTATMLGQDARERWRPVRSSGGGLHLERFDPWDALPFLSL